MDAASTAYPPDDPRAVVAQRLFEQTLRDWMRDWRDRGLVLPADDPLQKYWPADPAAR